MKGDKKIIVNFNRLLAHEMTAANQHFLNAKIFKHWGLMRLNDIEYQESIDELNHADRYIDRILFLEGMISSDVPPYNLCNVTDGVEELLRVNLNLEHSIIYDLRECIVYADTVHDFVSRDIMIDILIDEEKHIDFLETEIALIKRVGIYNYLQSQLERTSNK